MQGNLRESLSLRLAQHNQEHLLMFWEGLDEAQRRGLAEEIDSIDLDLLDRLVAQSRESEPARGRLEPEEYIRLPKDDASRRRWQEAAAVGEAALREGRVAAMVVAGGQGTRLGFAGPKGAFPIGPVTERTLFQIHAEKALAASRRYGKTIPLLVMTSPTNDAETKAFFAEHGYFGLPAESVRIFSQGQMPAVDDSGRLLLASPSSVFMSPNGHGGALKALWDSGTIEWLEARGVEVISYFQVDNPLVKVIDPSYIGFHIGGGAEMSLKLLTRTIPEEKLGIWLRVDGKRRVIEYSDMTAEDMAARDAKGGLLYAGGSIAIHCFSAAFIRRLNEKGFLLPYHIARKKVPFVDASGTAQQPREPNAVKFEMFIFDALIFAREAVAVETTREEEFSPVKNAEGADSPATARRDMSRLYGRWLAAAGVKVPLDAEGYPVRPIEISPLVADGPEALKKSYRGPSRVDGPLVLE